MQYRYDPYNRLQSMTYPDGEVVRYDYDLGGMLKRMYGEVEEDFTQPPGPGQQERSGFWCIPVTAYQDTTPFHSVVHLRPYVCDINYNEFGLRDSVTYGNGTSASYRYDSLQRLSRLRSYAVSGALMQDIAYTYDSVGNITHVANTAGSVQGFGGRYEGDYAYDNLCRLVSASGYWKDNHDSLPFSETMTYSPNGRLLSKSAAARVMDNKTLGTMSYSRQYSYTLGGNRVLGITQTTPHFLSSQHSFTWDACGNMLSHVTTSSPMTQMQRTFSWTEDNRLQTVADRFWFSYYQYDAGGDRTYKLVWSGTTGSVNGVQTIYYTPSEATLYASPYLVVTTKGYTKHYYAEAERVTSQLGEGRFGDVSVPVVDDSLAQVKLQAATGNMLYPSTMTLPDSAMLAYLDTLVDRQGADATIYWYHPDHLGSSSWITTTNGKVTQHLHYLPWGENFVDQRSSTFDGVRYTFSAKEKDIETGLSYFGSRYYSSDLSIWLSVDPQSDKYASLSPYVYCANNPVKLVDPNGEEIIISLSMDENGNRIVNISFTATLANKTSQNISAEEMEKYKNDIIAGIKKTFNGSLDDGTKVNVDVDITVLAKDEKPEPFTTRHEINIVDELVDMEHTAESIIGGGFINIRLDVCRGELEDDPMDRSAAHEFGHLLGLDHVKDENNIMNPDAKGRVITGNQILEACGNFFNYDINRGILHLETLRKLRMQANKAHKHH